MMECGTSSFCSCRKWKLTEFKVYERSFVSLRRICGGCHGDTTITICAPGMPHLEEVKLDTALYGNDFVDPLAVSL